MLNFLELARSRKTCRSYSPRPIAREDLELLAEAARQAPSACNAQPWKFIIVDDPGKKNDIAGLFPTPGVTLNAFAAGAAAFLAIVSEKQKAAPWIGGKLAKKDFRLIDIGIACAHIVLQAEELGIGACVLGWFDERKLARILEVPRGIRIELLITLGYPKDKEARREKRLKEKDETVSFNRYST